MATDIIARGMITEYIAGTNINFTENRDGTVEISASGSISSEDSVARDAIGNHKSDTSNPHNVTPAQIGLGNVDNTSDLDKPISTAVQQAIDNKADKTVATTSADGLMSAEDKTKLDSVGDTYALKSKYGDTTINIGRMVNAPIGEYSTSLGIGTVANGYASTAEGAGSQASELASHAGGYGSQAVKKCSFAHGYEVYAKHDYETAFGKHNVTNDDTLFSIGDGVEINTDGSISIARHNAFEITKTGGKLHDKDIATTNDIPNLSAYAKTADVPNIKVNSAGNADTVSSLRHNEYYIDIFSTSLTSEHPCWNKICYVFGQSTDSSAESFVDNAPEINIALWYEVETIGISEARGYQIAHGCYVHQRKTFIRYVHDGVWSDWKNIADVDTMVYTVDFSGVSWAQSGSGKFYYPITLNNVNKIISVSLGDFFTLSPDEIVQPCILTDQQIGIISNIAKSTGRIEIRVAYI